ncbi:class II fructose-bisphosphate aldolase [Candidatus Mycoplasma pogonae]
MLVNPFEVFSKANHSNRAILAFNVVNLETLQGVVAACETSDQPVIIQVTQGALNYAGYDYLVPMLKHVLTVSSHPFILHLDHCQDLALLQKAIADGFNSVMFDGSLLPLKENITQSQQAALIAKKNNVFLELEIGTIGGKEDNIVADKIVLHDVDTIVEFAQATKPDSLAIAFGTSHGIYKFEAELDFNLVKAVKAALKLPLVMHGTSGLSDQLILEAVASGINKVNVATDLLKVFSAEVEKYFQAHPQAWDLRKINQAGIEAVKSKVSSYLNLLK